MAKKRILIVDDEPQIVMLLKSRLERFGYEVEQAFTGQEARELLEQYAYDLVLLDFFLPDTLAGAEFCRLARASHHDLPIIIITGFSSREVETFLAEGASDVLYKPIHQDELVEKVNKYLV